jgi:signal peptidase I
MEKQALSSPVSSERKPRSRLLAVLLGVFTPFASYLYIGCPLRGVLLFAAFMSTELLALLVALVLPPTFPAVVIFGGMVALLPFGIYLFGIVDTARLAGNKQTVTYRWFIHVSAVAAVYVALSAGSIVSSAVKPHLSWRMFAASSESMQPTIAFGEQFLVDTNYFKTQSPRKGDVVVYRLRNSENTIYTKRVVAIAGDRVRFSQGHAIVNGTPETEPYAVFGDPQSYLNNTPEFSVPKNSLFMAGDNRANSSDSRLCKGTDPCRWRIL